jgi:DNA-binding response OmpR family regulator/HPt (histidine-containing phosphotransfer) domain-containing protein
MKILLVEDDLGAAEVLKRILEHQQYIVDLVNDGEAGLSLAQTFAYDLIVLDMMLPKLDGLMFCRQLRAKKNDTSVLLLTVLDSSTSKVAGLDMGADDYVVKPFDTDELLARIRALMRRGSPARSSVIQAGNIKLDASSSKVTCNGQILHLTAKEYALLELFLRNSHRIFSQKILLDYLWSFEELPSENTVRAHIKALRQKLKQAGADDLIETVYRQGYRLKLEEDKVQYSSVTVGTDSQPTVAPAAGSQLPQMQSPLALADIWKRYKSNYMTHVTVLEQYMTAMVADTLTTEIEQQAQASLHLLIGSLASFGFIKASRLCREIEQIFRTGIKQSQTQVEYLSQLLVVLQQEIEQPGASEICAAKRCCQRQQRFANLKKQRRLLIIDNDTFLCKQLIKEAKVWAIEAIAVTESEVRKGLAQNPNIVLLDLGSSDSVESGLELLRDISSNNLALPVVVFTSVSDLTTRLKVARLGGQIFLHKPMLPASVLAAVSQVLEVADLTRAKIMVLDNNPQMLDSLRTLLEPWGFELALLDKPLFFWERLNEFYPDLLILDTEMLFNNINSIELCQVVRSDPYWNNLPIIFLSARKDGEIINRVFMAGGDDYMSKPVVEPELIVRILNRLERTTISRKCLNSLC